MLLESKHKVSLFVIVTLVVSTGAPTAVAQEGPFASLHVAANRSQYTGRCPVELVYTATINFVMPHPKGLTFNYHWERSDGAKGAVQVVRPQESQRSMVLHEKWRLGAAAQHYDAGVSLFVNSGNAHLVQASPAVRVTCT